MGAGTPLGQAGGLSAKQFMPRGSISRFQTAVPGVPERRLETQRRVVY